MERLWLSDDADGILRLADATPLDLLCAQASAMRDEAHPRLVTYSPKVFIPLTKLCRNVCHYCTFAHPPRKGERSYLTREEVLDIARQGEAAGCAEALFTLGDKPELRYPAAQRELAALGHDTTISYLAAMCRAVLDETGLLPHVNAGVMGAADFELLRPVSASMGLMLETISERLCVPGEVHHGSPDKHPAARLATIELAGVYKVPFTTGILIGIGETRLERVQSLLALRALHRRYGHIQEIIIQNFRAKEETRAAEKEEPDLDEMRWTIAAARLMFGPEMNIQAPPNLSPGAYQPLIEAGINDWGGISPVTIDHVNPEAPWPSIAALRAATAEAGKHLQERLTIYPPYIAARDTWLDKSVQGNVLRQADSENLARVDQWSPGKLVLPQNGFLAPPALATNELSDLVARASKGERLDEKAVTRLFQSRGAEVAYVAVAADELRREQAGDIVRFVVNRNINYTNICSYKCSFCAFSKGKTHEALRGPAYDLDLAEIGRRAEEAWARGATEVCLQGGIHPSYTGAVYLAVCREIKRRVPAMHIHAFSPLEVSQGAATLNISIEEFLLALKEAGLGSLPGTAAEILDDEVRKLICPDKLNAGQWLDVMRAAHKTGLRTTSTIMFGHVEAPDAWSRHLLAIRDLQVETGGFTEFVPLPFVPMEAPMYLKGRARRGPTLREAVLMHAVARLVLNPLVPNIQASWVKMGPEGLKLALRAGANDAGGTLMNESISRAAGTEHGQELPPEMMREIIQLLGRVPEQRDTLYRQVSREREDAALNALPLEAVVQTAPSHPGALSNAIQ